MTTVMFQQGDAMKRTAHAAVWLLAAAWLAVGMLPAPLQAAEPAVRGKSSDEDSVPMAAIHEAKAPVIDIPDMRDPFESYIDVLEQQSKQRMAAQRSKEADHAHQPLENFDIGALTLVATMQMGGNWAAMVQDPEGKGYVVRKGSYIGKDNGRVVGISERSVDILEDEFTATGDIVKRKVSLTLNEVNRQ